MAAPGITAIKTFTYRGAPEEWSNTYHFVGDAPSNPADWRALCDEFAAQEPACYPATVTLVRFLCYEDTDNDSVYTYHLADFGGELPGQLATTGAVIEAPGDDAVWFAVDTGKRNSKGKPIWLRKYIHGALIKDGSPDEPTDLQKTKLQAVVDFMIAASGDWPGWADPHGDAPTGGTRVSSFITTRTLKRRGKRPT